MRDKFKKQLNTTLGQLSKAYELRSFTRNDITEVQKKERRVCNSISDCDDIKLFAYRIGNLKNVSNFLVCCLMCEKETSIHLMNTFRYDDKINYFICSSCLSSAKKS